MEYLIASKLKKDGFQILENFIPESTIETLSNLSSKLKTESTENRKNVFSISPKAEEIFQKIENKLNQEIIKCKRTSYCFYLEKTEEKNWPLQFHQDINLPKYLNLNPADEDLWLKKGFWVRINLDSNDERSGALKVIPKSHTKGKNIEFNIENKTFINANKGDIILFSPLLYHGSDKMSRPKVRRVFQCFFLKK